MYSRTRVPGDPIRQFLVAVPLGLLVMSLVFDLVAIRADEHIWWSYSWVVLYTGVTLSVIALPVTLVDTFALRPDRRLHRMRRLHEILHGFAVLLFAGSWMLRDVAGFVGTAALQLSLGGALAAVASAAFGDELVFRMRALRERRRSPRPAHYLFHPQR